MNDRGLAWEGIELIWVVLGFVGACLGIANMPKMGPWQLVSALVSGIVFAALAPQWADWAFIRWATYNPAHEHIPPFMNNSIAFLVGIGGMFLIPGLIVFWRSFAAHPLDTIGAIIDRLRGRAPPIEPHEEPKP